MCGVRGVRVWCLYVHMYIQGHWRPEEGIVLSGVGVTDACEPSDTVLGTKSRFFVRAASTLTNEPSLQP